MSDDCLWKCCCSAEMWENHDLNSHSEHDNLFWRIVISIRFKDLHHLRVTDQTSEKTISFYLNQRSYTKSLKTTLQLQIQKKNWGLTALINSLWVMFSLVDFLKLYMLKVKKTNTHMINRQSIQTLNNAFTVIRFCLRSWDKKMQWSCILSVFIFYFLFFIFLFLHYYYYYYYYIIYSVEVP